jgi:acrylyl-CoA reductase (NADPH)/3-hydroxypropionyl-CoA dehydratase/3-hydroxypropionyl-CoA synthetase
MTDPASVEDMAAYDMSGVKVATFCAEPVSPAVQQFAMDRICEHYINSYWATEHGGMVFSCPWGDIKPLRPTPRPGPCPGFRPRCASPRTDAAGRDSAWREAESR